MKRFYLSLCCFLLLLNGCGNSVEEKAVEKRIEKETGAKTDVDLSEKGVKITGESEGEKFSISSGESTQIPEGFPKDVLLYKPSEAVAAIAVSGGYSVTFSTPDDMAKVTSSYKEQMASEGWSEQASMNMGGQTILVYEKDGRGANVAIMSDEGKTQISVTLGSE